MSKIVLAGGCFWGLEQFFQQFPELKTEVGYVNGLFENPTYEQVCNGSGHTEALEIEYPETIQTASILAAFFAVIDPFSRNRQGNDIGINYRTGIYSNSQEERDLAKAMIRDIEKESGRPVAVEVLPLHHFYLAEEYHQDYLLKNPGGYCHIPRTAMTGHRLPTVEETEKAYPSTVPFLSKE